MSSLRVNFSYVFFFCSNVKPFFISLSILSSVESIKIDKYLKWKMATKPHNGAQLTKFVLDLSILAIHRLKFYEIFKYTRGVKDFKRIWKQWWICHIVTQINWKLLHLMRTLMLLYLNYYEYRLHKILKSEFSLPTKSMSLQKCVIFICFKYIYRYIFNISRNIKFCTHLSIAFHPTSSLFSILWIFKFHSRSTCLILCIVFWCTVALV